MWDFIKLVKTMEDYSNQKYSRRMCQSIQLAIQEELPKTERTVTQEECKGMI